MYIIWAASWQNQQNNCAPSEDSDQPGRPPSLIWNFAVRSVGSSGPNLSSCGQRRLWSDWADAQADLSLSWTYNHIVGIVTRRLICHSRTELGWNNYDAFAQIDTSAKTGKEPQTSSLGIQTDKGWNTDTQSRIRVAKIVKSVQPEKLPIYLELHFRKVPQRQGKHINTKNVLQFINIFFLQKRYLKRLFVRQAILSSLELLPCFNSLMAI